MVAVQGPVAVEMPALEPWGNRGKTYGDVSLHQNATSWQGDNYGTLVHNHFHQADLQLKTEYLIRILLRSLTFDRMMARVGNVARALPETCKWIFDNEDFREWAGEKQVPERRKFLWIKGKPGSGKSTVMKETVDWAEKKWSDHLVLTYFFNARSSHDLEKSSLGLYRSILHQVLVAHQVAQPLFFRRFHSKLVGQDLVEEWTITELQNFLVEIVTTEELPALVLFIDALDEGDYDDVRGMVAFLGQFIDHAELKDATIRVCLSSRHYPQISLPRALSIVVERQDEHQRDISRYINRKLAGGSEKALSQLRTKILDRSAGVFLWVVLVVSMLNKLYDRGKTETMMLRKLDRIPQDLQNVFASIVSRDSEDFEECWALLRWVLTAFRPLRPQELYLAVQVQELGDEDDFNDVPDGPTIERYILDTSRGLVEVTMAHPPIVQFIHETVRDFLLGSTGPRVSDALNVSGGHQSLSLEPSDCHAVIAEECVRYLVRSELVPSWANWSYKRLLLAKYAGEYWWRHVQNTDKDASMTLLNLSYELLVTEEALERWMEHYDPDLELGYHIHAGDVYTSVRPPPLYFAALIGFAELADLLLQRDAEVNATGGRCGTALYAACRGGHEKTVCVLLANGADVTAPGTEFLNCLHAASVYGHTATVEALLSHGADVNSKGAVYGTALHGATARGHENVVSILLKHGADVNAPGILFTSALHAASALGRETLVRLLIEAGANVNGPAAFHGEALFQASLRGHEQIVDTLLTAGADMEYHADGNALEAASSRGKDEVVQLLLSNKADVNARSKYYGTALIAASATGHISIVNLLIKHGADVKAQVGHFENALQAATLSNQPAIKSRLMEESSGESSSPGEAIEGVES